MPLLVQLGFVLSVVEWVSPADADELVSVTLKWGGAVPRAAGAPYADRMLRLPVFLREAEALPAGRDLVDGFALTGFFLNRYVLEPRGLQLGDERAHFIAALARALPGVA